MTWWHAYLFDNPLRRIFHKPEKLLAPYVEPGMTVLDVGCGMGHFSIGMAKMVGDAGCVIAADVQAEMLDVLARRAARAGVTHRIRTHRCEGGSLGVDDTLDFALAFWVVHEAPDAGDFGRQIHACLRPGGKLLVAEPKMHVSEPEFDETVDALTAAGLQEYDRPHVSLCRAALFERP
jgi:ubiquinone/menaquinone biosynthesis C-methylase UbiE